uniref:Putative reverse transcriptase domain-containing protein n=1 Tax=Tanacetum cinerariifolium TaxID=118510 RepID=A0A699L047_TANCI|nr:putative reverse transcriptase domain-containing protein [Tanacetum cinerariifolium]
MVFMDLMNQVCKLYLDKFVIVSVDDIFIYSWRNEEHEEHLRQLPELLKNKELYAEFSKCDFLLPKVELLGHIVDKNAAADALSRNEQAKPLRVGALVMTIKSNLPPQIHEARVEALKKKNIKDENLHGMDKDFKNRLDETLSIRRRSWLPHFRDLRKLTMRGSHKSNYFIHHGSDKIYHNLKQLYRWPNMEAGISTCISKCLACLRIRDAYQKPFGLLVQSEMPIGN